MGDGGLINGGDRYKLLKQVVTVTQPNVWQRVRASQVLGDDHYEGMAGVAIELWHD